MEGKPISLVKEALLLFIQSLPKKSYFHLIGFGTYFKKYNEVPVEYNEENFAKIINIIKELDADQILVGLILYLLYQLYIMKKYIIKSI